MYLVNADSAPSDDSVVSSVVESCKHIYSQMADDETLWIICSNQYKEQGCQTVGLEIADCVREDIPFILKNTVTVHTDRKRGGNLDSIYKEILFLVKDKREYKFNKDDIRIPHVYKGNEWGGEREKGSSAYHDTEVRRYNPDGKDPSNVWTREDRTETGGENVDRTEPIGMEEAIQRCVRVGSDEDEVIHTLWMDVAERIEGREVRPLEAK
jgi:hypothetical protein